MDITIEGRVHSYKEDEKSVTNGYPRKNLIIVEDSEYPQYHKIEIAEKLYEKFDVVKAGDNVTVECNLNGRLWIDKETNEEKGCFTSIRGWRLIMGGSTNVAHTADTKSNESVIDNLPF